MGQGQRARVSGFPLAFWWLPPGREMVTVSWAEKERGSTPPTLARVGWRPARICDHVPSRTPNPWRLTPLTTARSPRFRRNVRPPGAPRCAGAPERARKRAARQSRARQGLGSRRARSARRSRPGFAAAAPSAPPPRLLSSLLRSLPPLPRLDQSSGISCSRAAPPAEPPRARHGPARPGPARPASHGRSAAGGQGAAGDEEGAGRGRGGGGEEAAAERAGSVQRAAGGGGC